MPETSHSSQPRNSSARALLAILLLLLAGASAGQIFTITDGVINSCTGALLDSGGQGAGGYNNSESYTATICADVPGQNINLTFVTFNLDQTGSSPIDNLAIYDGTSPLDPLLGVWTGTSLQGATILASPLNPSGCLTLVFTSNETGTGVFGATISCVIPCFPPVAVAQINNEPTLPALVCPDEVLTFDATASFPQPGFNIVSYEWDFYDGSTATGATATHAFAEPGAYFVQLTITDDNGCVNSNTVDLEVHAGTTPLFTGTTADLSVCQGGTVDLTGLATPVLWSALPTIDYGAGVYLPDNVGQTFTSQLSYSFFPPGSTLNDVNDLMELCIDIEHSFMGDFVMTVTCPNGQSTILYQQGGGGTNLGIANLVDGANPQPGTCWNYCFSPNAPNGTWVQAVNAGMTTPTASGPSLTPGTYTSVQPLSNLVGCPLNGTWTFSFTDLWLIDNGFLCSWNINFNPALYPDLVQFTPTIVDAMWSGPGLTSNPGDPYAASLTPTVPGSYDYDFTVTDDFGCTYDTTITVTVTNAPEVEATAILGATCSEPTLLHAEIVAYPPPPPDCEWTLVMHDSFGDGWNGGASLTILINGVPTNYVMAAGGNNSTVTIAIPFGCSIQLQWTAGTIWNNENSFELLDYAGGTVYDSPQGPATGTLWQGPGSCGANVGPVTWQWTPAAGVDLPNAPDATTQITQPTEFVVRVFPFGQPWCFTTDTILVTPPSFLENDSVVVDVLCNGNTGSITLITTGLGGPWNYSWVNGSGTNVQTTNASDGDVLTIGAGTYTAYISEGPTGNGCLDTLTATITEPPLLEWVTTPVDTLICLTGLADLEASAQGGTGTIALQWNQGLAGNGPHSVSPADTTLYTVVAVDANGCTTLPASATVFVRPALSITPLEPDTECYGLPVLMTAFGATGGDGAYTYDWGAGPQLENNFTFLLPVSNTVCVTLQDGCETPAITSCAWLEILQTPPIVISADTTFGCAPFAVRFILQDTTLLAQVQWSYGDGHVIGAMDSVVHTYSNAGNYDLGAVITWPNGCITDTLIDDMVRVITVPIADMSWYPHPPTINDPIVQFTDLSLPNVVSWWWDFGEDFGTSTEQNPVIEYPDEVGGNYPVMLVVANELGCTDTLRSVVEVHDEFMVWVPNAFTPDGNEHNQFFFVSGNDLSPEEFELLIFDRWGHLVHSSTDLYEKWDGTSGGTALPQGVYVWKLEIHSLSSRQKREIMGHVNLLR
ncbi:MAG: gliding motility-associated C-terminal domain-containing protein [Flavobacteriales bacterium]|nr:gliding motility-associated C-terminal domain-containing protein [Flavobacteriales bacterium]